MGKGPATPPVQGSPKATDIYVAVGIAISFWEASEDELMGLFRLLCAEREPTAFETYVASPRSRRNELLKAAINRYGGRFQGQEIEQVLAVMKKLDKLAATRNEIAHGHCSHGSGTENGKQTMSGHYLLPSLNERGWQERSFRFAHTAGTINAFTAAVREQRGIIMDIWSAIMIREQEAEKRIDRDVQATIELAKAVAFGQIPPEAVPYNLRRVVTPPAAGPSSPAEATGAERATEND